MKKPIGSLLVVEADHPRQDAEAIAAGDPYAMPGLSLQTGKFAPFKLDLRKPEAVKNMAYCVVQIRAVQNGPGKCAEAKGDVGEPGGERPSANYSGRATKHARHEVGRQGLLSNHFQ